MSEWFLQGGGRFMSYDEATSGILQYNPETYFINLIQIFRLFPMPSSSGQIILQWDKAHPM